MALLAAVVELNLSGVWTDVSSYVASARDVVRITRGRQDEQAQPEPSKASFSLNNRDGRFSPRNPMGPYYGIIGRNTPVRISLPGYGYRFFGEISSWPITWDASGQDAWTKVEAAGILRRLSQGVPPLEGPITRFATSAGATPAIAYWPLTDPPGSSSLASGLNGGLPMAIEGVGVPRLSTDSSFATSDPLPEFAFTSFRGFPSLASGPDIFCYFLLSVPDTGDTNDSVLLRFLTNGSAFRWEIRYFSAAGGQLQLRCFDSAGASILTSALAFAVNGIPSIVRLDLDQSGGNVSWSLSVTKFLDGSTSFVAGALAGTLVSLYQVQMSADRVMDGTAVGHLTITNTAPASVTQMIRGWTGETAGRRIERLCAEEGVPLVTEGDLDDTEAMGMQTAGTLLDLLLQCEEADMGLLHEPRTALALAYRTRKSLYAQAPTLELTYPQLSAIQPVEDDQRTRNDVIVSRKFGSSARATVTTGPLSVLAPPNGVGRYQDTKTLVLASDDQLQYQADWRVRVGTIDEPRYPILALDVYKYTGASKTNAAALDVGDLMTVSGTPIWVPREGVAALAIGYQETIGPAAWLLELNAIPGTPWDDIFVLDSTTNGRLDATTLVTNEPLDTTETGVDYAGEAVITTATAPGEFPVSLLIGGEQMTNTGTVGATMTVVRSANGVIKSHLTAAPIQLARPGVLAL